MRDKDVGGGGRRRDRVRHFVLAKGRERKGTFATGLASRWANNDAQLCGWVGGNSLQRGKVEKSAERGDALGSSKGKERELTPFGVWMLVLAW